jgi:hypothetical protein
MMIENTKQLWQNPEFKQRIVELSKQNWANPEWKEQQISKVFLGMAARPTRAEKQLDELLQEYFPNQWIYNGDYSQGFQIDGKIPDFVPIDKNCNKVIELFSYHHCPALFGDVSYDRTEKGRVELFKKYGYDCLIIWQPELWNFELAIQKVKEFMVAS